MRFGGSLRRKWDFNRKATLIYMKQSFQRNEKKKRLDKEQEEEKTRKIVSTNALNDASYNSIEMYLHV